MEKRTLRTTFETSGNKLVGYASVFNAGYQVTERGRTYTEIVRPGAFARSIREGNDVLCCFNHDVNRLLGRTSSGTMAISEDNTGLRFEVDLPDTPTGNEVRGLCNRQDLQGASFAFVVKSDKWQGQTREILDVELFECGPVVTPASPATSVNLRSNLNLYKLRLREIES